MIIDFLWGGVAPHAMSHAKPGARYIQVGNSAGAASTITGLVLRNKLLTLVGHSLFATPAEVRRSAYAQMAGHAIDGKLTVDLERTRLEDTRWPASFGIYSCCSAGPGWPTFGGGA